MFNERRVNVMDKLFVSIKVLLAAVGSFIAHAIGGVDALLILLLTLIVCDIATGVLNAVVHKNLCSTTMREGFVHKVFIFILIIISVRLDVVIVEYFSKDLNIRAFVLAFFCLEELISILENTANAGVPIPKWLRIILKKVSNDVNTTTPRFVIDAIKKLLNINVDDEKKDKEQNPEDKDKK